MATHRDVTITKVDHEGRALISYPGAVVYADQQVVVARCAWTHDHEVDLGPFRLQRGDIFIEYYYRHESFNVFAIFDPTGRIKGWYCNVTDRVDIEEREIRWHDLALDVLVLPSGQQLVLDEDEFEDLNPTASVREFATCAVEMLRAWASAQKGPFLPILFS